MEHEPDAAPSSRPSVGLRVGRVTTAPVRWWWGFWRGAYRAVAEDTKAGHRAIWGGRWVERLRSAFQGLNRDPDRIAAMRQSWRRVQQVWGFTAEDEPNIRRGLLMELVIYSLVGVLGVFSTAYLLGALAHGQPIQLLLYTAPLLIPVGVLGGLGRLWRYRVIRERRFTPFLEWLIGGTETDEEEEDRG